MGGDRKRSKKFRSKASKFLKETAHWFTVDDLNFLKRGGRISASAAWFGSALKIKPVLHVDNNGKLIPMEKKIGRKKSLARIAEI